MKCPLRLDEVPFSAAESSAWTAQDWIAPSNLLSLVCNTAPYLFTDSPDSVPGRLIDMADFRGILASGALLETATLTEGEQLEDYFALCLACHHATVATFVPTDVDTKIRGLIWGRVREPESLRRMFAFAVQAHSWGLSGVSNRVSELAGVGRVSGHDGEILSVFAGALGAFLKAGDEESIGRAADAIDTELRREAVEFQWAAAHKGHELDLLRLSATLTHNAGDLDQGLSFWPDGERFKPMKARFGRLAHENAKPYEGTFQVAARIYKAAMAPEGHRNYPLRGVRALRRSPDLLLPQSPFLDDWGATIATHSSLSAAERAEVLAALLAGCRKIPGQRGYFRAIHGMSEALGGSIDDIVRLMPSAARDTWKNPQLRKAVAVAQASFESSMKKLLTASR